MNATLNTPITRQTGITLGFWSAIFASVFTILFVLLRSQYHCSKNQVKQSVMNKLKLSGLLLFLAGSFALMGIITAEVLYPSGYTTFRSEISDLGATKPPNSLIYQPSASIFNITMLLSGLMALMATFYQHRYFKKLLFSIPLSLFGLGLVGIGFFSGEKVPYHGIFSLLTFISGGVSGIMSFNIVSAPFKFIGIVFGSISLITWCAVVFAPNIIVPFIGLGGTERWIVYPIVLWITGLGGYLMNKTTI